MTIVVSLKRVTSLIAAGKILIRQWVAVSKVMIVAGVSASRLLPGVVSPTRTR
jgi:hypothetical protein